MVWFLVIALTVVSVLALLALVVLTVWLTEDTASEDEAARIEWEVRRAERRLHDVASDAFAAMLDEARRHNAGRVS